MKETMTASEQMVKEAFELLDWLDGCECGGVKPQPHIREVSLHDTKVWVSYYYDRVYHPYSDVTYHTSYDPNTTYTDVFRIEDGKLKVESATELHDLVGLDDIFKNYRNHPWPELREAVARFERKWF